MATGPEVLKYYGITSEQAMDFIMANVNHPEVIYNGAMGLGITTQHLSDITGYSTDDIKNYFESSGLDTYTLDEVRILFNSNLGDLNYLVGFNDLTGALSTASLAEQVKASVDSSYYHDYFFTAAWDYQHADGIYSPDELGTSKVGSIPDTNESIESLFYGALINQYIALDSLEIDQITNFKLTEANFNEYQVMLHDALVDVPSTPFWTDNALAELVYKDAINIINGYDESPFIGILDNTFLGNAIAEWA